MINDRGEQMMLGDYQQVQQSGLDTEAILNSYQNKMGIASDPNTDLLPANKKHDVPKETKKQDELYSKCPVPEKEKDTL